MGLDKFEKQVDEIFTWFDWDRVQKTMTLLEWNWASVGDENPSGIPNQYQMMKTAKRLLKSAWDSNRGNSKVPTIAGTGGFQAECWYDRDLNKKLLSLKFIVSEWNYEEPF